MSILLISKLPIELLTIIDNYLYYKFRDNYELRIALNLWNIDILESEKKYGNILTWNLINITDNDLYYIYLYLSTLYKIFPKHKLYYRTTHLL